MFRRFCAALVVAVAVGVPGVAWAEPAPIDDGSGPRDVGARIDDGSGVPGPSFDTPVSIPSVGEKPVSPGEDATEEEKEEYARALASYEAEVAARDRAVASERARQIARAQKECTRTDHEQACW